MYALLIMLALAQKTVSQDVTVRVDDKGDAAIEIQFQLGAKSWISWRSMYGDHPNMKSPISRSIAMT